MPQTHTVSEKTRVRLFALNQQFIGAKTLFDAMQVRAQAIADEYNNAFAAELDHYDLVPGENIAFDFRTGVITVADPPPATPETEAPAPTPIRPDAAG